MKFNSLICFFWLIVLAILSTPAKGQNPRFDSYKILDNRKNVQVSAIFQDSSGYIWLGTQHGLVKYDGKKFNTYTQKDSLYSNTITSINQDFNKRLWIGHKSGKITYQSGNQFIKFSPEEGLPKEEISSFYFDHDSIMWFSTFGEGVYYYKGKHRKRLYNLSSGDGLLDNYVYAITQDNNGNYYFATDRGISIYNSKKDTFPDKITMSDGLPDNIVKHMVIRNNVLWIAMEDGGICSHNLTNGDFFTFHDWEFGSVNDFVRVSDTEIWVSTEREGVVKCEIKNQGIQYSVYNEELGLADKRTNTIYTDRENNIWIGTRNGVSLRKNNHFEFLSDKDGLNINHIFSFTIDNKGNYWVASQGGLYRISINKMGMMKQKKLFSKSKHENTSFISLFKDNEGYIWAGTYGYGVFKINPQTLNYENLTTSNGMSDNNVINITQSEDKLWFSTLGGGVTRYNKETGKYKIYTTDNGLTSSYVYSVFIDSRGRKWISTDGGGVLYIKNNTIHSFSDSIFSEDNKVVYNVTEDKQGNIWFNTPGQGLVVFDGKSFHRYNMKNGLKTNTVQSIIPDGYGNLIIVSNQGVDKLNIKDSLFEYHGEEDGVAYWEPNLNAVYKDSTDNVWIGTKNGILKYNARAANEANVLPKIFITKKIVNFNELEKSINRFKYNENHVTFHYNALWYQASRDLTYRYRLKGYDLDWNPETGVKMATYSNLPPGQYSFVVQVKYADSKWIESKNSRYSFTIKPPFWETTWFIVSAIILILAGIYVFIRLRLRKLRHDRDRLEEEVKKRTAEIQKQKEEIEAQRDEIEAQRDNVVKQRNKIEKQNKEIKSSILYASRIQTAVLPPKESFDQQIGEHFILFKPKDIVSGDFYYLNTKSDKIVVAAADCTGHGVPGAFMSMLGTSLLNHILSQLDDDFTAGDILTRLRDEVKSALRQSEQMDLRATKDGMDMSLCVIQRGSKTIHYAGAYNPLLIIRDKQIIRYKGDPMPIGIHLKEKDHFTDHTVEVKEKDMIYMYSDGYQDQFGGERNRKFLPKNLRNKLLEVSEKQPEEQYQMLNQTFEDWKGDNPQVDDVLLIGIKI
jgi:ligand-binding sensor domain-containing protein/serine phosphatase RsbU (regulator of sigma subunit)